MGMHAHCCLYVRPLPTGSASTRGPKTALDGTVVFIPVSFPFYDFHPTGRADRPLLQQNVREEESMTIFLDRTDGE